jgi:hypothetical protein
MRKVQVTGSPFLYTHNYVLTSRSCILAIVWKKTKSRATAKLTNSWRGMYSPAYRVCMYACMYVRMHVCMYVYFVAPHTPEDGRDEVRGETEGDILMLVKKQKLGLRGKDSFQKQKRQQLDRNHGMQHGEHLCMDGWMDAIIANAYVYRVRLM